GDTPTLRLQQDGSSGFAPQTWDVAGSETNFFIRDVTNGSSLPFRIRPGAPTSSIFIDVPGDVGIGTSSPDAPLHVLRSNGEASILVEETNGTADRRELFKITNNGPTEFKITNTNAGASGNWDFTVEDDGTFRIGRAGPGVNEVIVASGGDVTIAGEITTSGSCSIGCDRVFTPEYEL
ncbi:MAG: hypothetical protein GY769_11520, partial [bacterium]|nr:hypothetical protein [bacterium]